MKRLKSPIKNLKPSLAHITPALCRLAVAVKGLHPDPRNARRHDERNLAAIQASLTRFGQQAPVVFVVKGRQRIVIKGNGILAAAKALGWKEIAAVESGLEADDATAYAIADNRATDLSTFDPDILTAQLKELEAGGFDLESAGFTEKEMADLLQDLEAGDGSDAEGRAQAEKESAARKRKVSELFSVIVECKNEREQLAFYRRMQKEHRRCKLYVL